MEYGPWASDEDSDSRENPGEGEPPLESIEEEATLPSPCHGCLLSSGSITALWGPQTSVRWHQQMQIAAAGTNSLFYSWVPSVGPVHTTTPCCGQGTSPRSAHLVKWEPSTAAPKYFPVKYSLHRARRSTNNEEVSKVKAMWRAGEVTKPAYVRFCNRIHLLT